MTFDASFDLAEKSPNTLLAPHESDEDCLHKASGQSDMGKIE